MARLTVPSLTGNKVLFVHSRDIRNKDQDLVATVWTSVGRAEIVEVSVLNT